MRRIFSKTVRCLSYLGGLIALVGLSREGAGGLFRIGWGITVVASGLDLFLCERGPGEIKDKRILGIAWFGLLVSYLWYCFMNR